MSIEELEKNTQDLLIHLYRQTGADPSVQVSMYEVGASLGFDREATSRMTEDLIGWELVELHTLAGEIGISAKAVGAVEASGLVKARQPDGLAAFGNRRIIDADGRQAVERVSADIKSQAGSLGMAFDRLSEVLADLKTIDAQLDSPQPKTAIVRECFRSLQSALESVDADDIVRLIGRLIKE